MRPKKAGCAGTKRHQRRPAWTDARDLLQEATEAELKLHLGLLNVRPYPAPGEAESGLRLCRSALNRCPAEREREREKDKSFCIYLEDQRIRLKKSGWVHNYGSLFKILRAEQSLSLALFCLFLRFDFFFPATQVKKSFCYFSNALL